MNEPIALVCRVCGGDFIFPAGELLHACPACGTSHARPRATGQGLADLRRAHQQRMNCDFTNAEASYQCVLRAHPEEAEALWGLALCKYGVEYVRDEKSGKFLPVIHFLKRTPFTEDPDFRLAIARASDAVRAQYQQDAEYIARIQQRKLTAEQRGDTWDIFLCYKASVPGQSGARTREFGYAQELYIALRDAGYSVFFAHQTLRHAAGADYEAQIFHALQSAKVMLVIVSEPGYLRTPWVHSEWSRYLERVDKDEGCLLIPLLYDGCDPYELPDEFVRRSIQGLGMETLTALDDLRGILDKCIPVRKRITPPEFLADQMPPSSPASPLLRRAFLYLEDGDWQNADAYCERVLDIEPENARAYLAKLMASLRVSQMTSLRDQKQSFEENPNYQKALRFADEALAQVLRETVAHIRKRNLQESQMRSTQQTDTPAQRSTQQTSLHTNVREHVSNTPEWIQYGTTSRITPSGATFIIKPATGAIVAFFVSLILGVLFSHAYSVFDFLPLFILISLYVTMFSKNKYAKIISTVLLGASVPIFLLLLSLLLS